MTNIPVLYAFVSTSPGEGLVAGFIPGLSAAPFVTGSEKVLPNLTSLATEISRATGQKIELRKYTVFEVVETIGE